MAGQRLDKWLWCARLVKTRSLASRLIAAGKVRINGERTLKASHPIQAGDVVTGTSFRRLWVVRVVANAERRGPASLARSLYEDLTPPETTTSDQGPVGPRSGARPTKRDRRRMDALKTEEA
jgi:ribosome-associated heat shock protein Hsp15